MVRDAFGHEWTKAVCGLCGVHAWSDAGRVPCPAVAPSMTRAEAVSTGQNAATTFGKVFVVYRLPAWPPDVFGCRAEDKGLPPGTETFERLAPGGSAKASPPASTGQGGLLFEDVVVPNPEGLMPIKHITLDEFKEQYPPPEFDLEDDSEIGDI